MQKDNVVTVQTAEPLHASPAVQRTSNLMTPAQMLQEAVLRGSDIAILERLMGLQERWEAAEAKKAFFRAKAAFQAEAAPIIKDRENKQYGSMYASIGNIVNTTNPILGKHGLSPSWEYEQTDKSVKVTCTLTHEDGHSDSVSLSGSPDASGSKNPIQQIKSATTYLRAATFEAVTGIASSFDDDDGNASCKVTETINESQFNELCELADSTNASKAKFCAHFKIDHVGALPAKDFERAKRMLLAKRNANAA